MSNTSNTNERVFYLTEGEIKRIVSESTVAVLNEGLWSGIGKGLRKVFRSGEGKKMLSKGKELGKKALDYGKSFAKEHWPSPQKARLLNKFTPPQSVSAALRGCCPNNAETLGDVYEYIYNHQELWNKTIPGHGMTYSQFEKAMIDLLYETRKGQLDDFIAKLERGERFNVPPEMSGKFQKARELYMRWKRIIIIGTALAGVLLMRKCDKKLDGYQR